VSTVFLAFVIFAKLGTEAPLIVAGYRTLDACLADAGSRNRAIGVTAPAPGSGFVCLEMRGET
jgi:hypothetical protein